VATAAIRTASVSKRYRIGSGYGYKTLRESLTSGATHLLRRRPQPDAEPGKRFVWALKDVSFDVAPGELVGIIGPNGAGKTTVLKSLSRITKPTSGWAEVCGRVGSLLEVGTGFHPELTGRENVYLNGAILGMRKSEIKRRFDEIVDFADIGDFLDTPIKRYSSGMKVRLAFAVAAYLEPEILIVDEVLAVGDVAFQKKCIGKIGEVTAEGRTVLFVSHNMSLIRALCQRGILLSGGSVVVDSAIDEAVDTYLRSLENVASQSLLERGDRRGWNEIVLSRVEIVGSHGGTGRLVTGESAKLAFHLTAFNGTGAVSHLSCSFTILDRLGLPVTTLSSAPPTADDRDHTTLIDCFECTIDELLLVAGRYRLDVTIRGRNQIQDHVEGAAFFDVEEGLFRGRPIPEDGPGVVVLPHRWRTPLHGTSGDSRPLSGN
jgi:lipopolysaccharide transport system ATP-binding protein